MENAKINYIFKKLVLFLIAFSVSATYLVLALVFIMFLFSSLHILNPDIFNFNKLDFVTGALVVVILGPSVLAFFKAFKKTYKYFDTIISKTQK